MYESIHVILNLKNISEKESLMNNDQKHLWTKNYIEHKTLGSDDF